MTQSFFKDIVKEIDNDYAGLLSDGSIGDIGGYIDSGSYIFNALVSGSIYGGIPSNLSLIHISEPTRQEASRMPSSA